MARHITIRDEQYWKIKEEMAQLKIKKYGDWIDHKLKEIPQQDDDRTTAVCTVSRKEES